MSEGFKDRLRRLRREDSADAFEPDAPAGSDAENAAPSGVEPASSAARAALPIWFRARAARRIPELEPATAPPKSFALPAEMVEQRGPRGAFGARVLDFANDHVHGDWRLSEVTAAGPERLALCARDPALAELDPRRAVYLDIETSGLSGGAGVHPFLVGLGWFEGDAFRLWQGFVREPAEEAAMLARTAELVDARDGLVSFFGKSFDRHRLEDKMRVFGIAPPFAGRPHLDLYHVCQRLYRSAFADGRLATMERELCGLERPDDLPGSFAPGAWFDFLAGRPHRLAGVFQHNVDDVLSLVTLTAHLGRALDETRSDGRPLGGPSATRAAGLARLVGASDPAAGLAWLERAIERRRSDGHAPPAAWLLEHAELARRAGATEHALASYRAVLAHRERQSAPREPATEARERQALTRLAMLCEHAAKDRVRALGLALTALAHARAHGAPARECAALEARLARLRTKLQSGARAKRPPSAPRSSASAGPTQSPNRT